MNMIIGLETQFELLRVRIIEVQITEDLLYMYIIVQKIRFSALHE